jgi:hypothetical protein
MQTFWKAGAVACLGFAALQWLKIATKLVHAIELGLKVGFELPLARASTHSFAAFCVLSGAALLVSLSVRSRVKTTSPPFTRMADVATVMLLAGACLWLGLVASPLIELR